MSSLPSNKGVIMIKIDNLRKVQEGDLKSIEEICAATWEPVYRYIYYKVQNREEAEDIVQETYIKAFRYIEKKNFETENFIAFLKTVSLNILRDRWRQSKRQGINVNLDLINPLEAAAPDPTNRSIHRMAIKDALNKLNSEQRKVIEMRILLGYSVAETAKIMNKTEANIRVLQHRTLKILSEILESSN
jgi:RNA polymerase sigma-70 factor (ECF subfamily)